jgi:CheY-like chemotaxis protein
LSLSGNLEDLPLLDILQIVTYSRKTGFLAINTSGGLGAIVFSDGLVVSAFSPETRPLQLEAGLTPEKREAALRTRVEIALEQLIRLREGNFEFSLTEKTPRVIDGRDIRAELLEDGFNAQGLLLDLARGIDEDRRNSTAALEASFVDPPVDADADTLSEIEAAAEEPRDELQEELESIEEAEIGPLPEELRAVGADEVQAAAQLDMMPGATPPPTLAAAAGGADTEPPAILLVDDEADVRQVLVESFTAAGYQVIEADEPEIAVKKAGKLARAGVRFILICDLGMPTSGGSSFQGGFEVVKKLLKMHMHPPVLLMAERLSGALQARAKQLGVASIVFKPGLSKLDPDQFRSDLRAFADRLKRDILPGLAASATPGAPGPENKKPAARPRSTGGYGPEEGSRDIAVLQLRLEELRRQSDPTQISYMVMKTAREFFERGILLLIKDAEARGLAGFGPAPRGENINLVVRDVIIPLSEPSPFADAITGRKPLIGVEPTGRWMSNLYGKIGKFRATNGAILPLLAHREVIALLYGDNPETGREVRRADALALFVDQAGLALENLFLQRKVHSLETGRAGPVAG